MAPKMKESSISLSSVQEEITRMSDQYNLTWRETAVGIWEREVDELEMFYTSLAKNWEGMGRTYFSITAYLGFSVPLSVEVPTLQTEQRVLLALKKAWKKLRYDHPTLAASVTYDPSNSWCKKIYQTPLDNGKSWLDDTFKIIDTGQSGHEFANTDPPPQPYATLYVINPPLEPNQFAQHRLRRDLVFTSNHDIIDGIGTLVLLNNLMRHASEAYDLQDAYPTITFGDESKNLSPPFRIAASLPVFPTVSQLQRFNSIQATNALIRDSINVLSIPFTASPTTKPRRSKRTVIHFTASQSATIIRKCKESAATPTHVIHTSIALAIRDLQERAEEETEAAYVSYALINLRETCLTPFNTAMHPAGVYHSVSADNLSVTLVIPATSSVHTPGGSKDSDDGTGDSTIVESAKREEFESVMKVVKSFYHDLKIDADYLSTVPTLFALKTAPYPLPPYPAPLPTMNQNPSASLSSMGIVDKIIQPLQGDFTVTSEPWVLGAEYSPGIGVFLGTWRGIIGVSAVWNDAFHTEPEVKTFLKNIRSIVLDGLAVESG